MAVVCKKTQDLETQSVDFEFTGDEEPITISVADFSPEIVQQFTLHGIAAKLGDAYSGSKGDVDRAKALFNSALTMVLAGDWRASRGDGESKPRLTELVSALARIKGIELADAQSLVDALDDDKKKALRSHSRIKAVIQTIRGEKAQAKLDSMEGEALDL